MMASGSRKRPTTTDKMDVDEDGILSDNHQLLLQYLMHVRMAKKMALSQVHGKLFNDSESLNDSLLTISSKINPLKMDIKSVVCDISGETYLVLINSTGEPFFPKCCIFSQPQVEFLKKVLEGIVLSENGSIGKIQALNSCKTLQTKSDAEDTIREFIREKILLEMSEGRLCLSPLAIVEFEPFFRCSFEDNMYFCDLCRQLVFVGKTCQGCNNRFHRHCVKKWLASKRSECPNCKNSWQSDIETETD